MPRQKPGRSVQDYQTPTAFLDAVKHKLGIVEFSIDLAADEINTAADRWYDAELNALLQTWGGFGGWAWCNPPFATLDPWVQKAWTSSRDAQVAMLVPAGVGSNWWARYVDQKARVLLLNGRITFVGQPTCYPKDCCLLLYGPTTLPGYEVWTWPRAISGAGAADESTRAATRSARPPE